MAKGVRLVVVACGILVGLTASFLVSTTVNARDTGPAKRLDALPSVWHFSKSSMEGGGETSNLTLTIGGDKTPTMDARCSAAPSGNPGEIEFTLVVVQPKLAQGDGVRVNFSTGRFFEGVDGKATDDSNSEGRATIAMHLPPTDQLWQKFASLDVITYEIPRGAKDTLALKVGEEDIHSFVTACTAYAEKPAAAEAGTPPTSAAPQAGPPPSAGSGIPGPSPVEKGSVSGSEPEQPEGPKLATVDRGPGTTPWENEDYVIGFGDTYEGAAMVQGNGSKLYAYCSEGGRVALSVSSDGSKVYPDFDERVAQGLEASRGAFDDKDESTVELRFSDGKSFALDAGVEDMSGDLLMGSGMEGGGVAPDGAIAKELMSAAKVTISAAPFAATYQLTGSRTAICSAMQQCKVSMPDCDGSTTAWRKAPVCKKGGVIYNEHCVYHARQVTVTHGCAHGFHLVGGVCVRLPHHLPLRLPHIRFRR